jgi:hypothetical protein
MWRAFFLALGISLAILGGECLMIHKVTLASEKPAAQQLSLRPGASGAAKREFSPPEWAPWSLLGSGVLIMLYSFTIPGGDNMLLDVEATQDVVDVVYVNTD